METENGETEEESEVEKLEQMKRTKITVDQSQNKQSMVLDIAKSQ